MINQFKDEYQKLINDFSVIDENDPITEEKLSLVNSLLNSSTDEYTKIKSDLKKKKNNYDKKNNHTTKKYNKKVENIEEIYKEKITQNKENHTNSCNKLKNKLEQFKIDSSYDIQQIEINFDFFSTSIEQSKLVLFDDFLKNKKRYDYQLQMAKNTYSDIVQTKNIELENSLTQINNNYVTTSLNLKKETVNSTLSIQEKIAENEKELNQFLSLIQNENNSLKEKYRQESTLLNEQIKKIIAEKNNNLDNMRNEYNQTLLNMNLEKEDKKNELHAKSQAILKDFVTKINEIDAETNELKTNYEKTVLEIKRNYYNLVYNKTKVFHEEILDLHTSITDKKYLNKLLRFKNNQYASDISFIKKDAYHKLKELAKEYNITINQNKTNKTLLDLDKNYNIKSLSDEEQFYNKYYQEKANIYENDYNLYVKRTNNEFNQKVNDVKTRSQKRTKLLERNHLGIDINYSKRIETITNKINKLKYELSYEKDLERIFEKYEENKYTTTLNLTKATNLLEIEKHKLLKEYNIDRYNNQINGLELDKSYGLKRLDIENEYKNINKNYEIKHIKLSLEKNIITTSYAIKKEDIYEKFNKEKINIVKNNSEVTAKEKYINTLKDNNLFYLNLLKDSFIEFSTKLISLYNNVIDTIIENVEDSPSNATYIYRFVSKLTNTFTNLYNTYLGYYISLINDSTNEKIAFIHDFRYKTLFENLKDNYQKEQLIVKTKKDEIEKKIDLNNKTIENVKNKIFTLINDNEMIEKNNSFHKKDKNNMENQIIADNLSKIQDYKEKNEQYYKLNKSLIIESNEISKLLKAKFLEYKQARKILKNKKYFDTKIFISFKENTNLFFYSVINKLNNFTKLTKKDNIKSLSFINGFKGNFNKILRFTNKGFTELLDNYNIKINKENLLRTKINKNNYKKDIQDYTNKLNIELENYNKEYSIAINQQNRLLEDNSKNIENNNSYFEKMMDDASYNYELESRTLQRYFKQQTNVFYEHYYSLSDNNTNIINYHNSLLKQNENDFKNQKNIFSKNYTNLCNNSDNQLKKILDEKNASIQNLPIIYKNNSKSLEKNFKRMQNDLTKEIKLAKINHYLLRKNLDKEINNFKDQLEDLLKENSLNLENNIKTEQKNSEINCKQAIRSIKIVL